MGMLSRLAAKLPDQGEQYVGRQVRAMVTQLEGLFARVTVDTGSPAFAVTANYTVTASDELLLVDTTAGSLTVTLPLIGETMIAGKFEVSIKKATAGNVLTILPTGADLIDDELSVIITAHNTSLTFKATTDGWRIV